MEYGTKLNEICDLDNLRHIGYDDDSDIISKQFFSKKTIDVISKKCSELLMGVDPKNRKIIIPDKTICEVMSSVKESYRPSTGCIHSRYTVPVKNNLDVIQDMSNEVIEIITSDVKNNIGIAGIIEQINTFFDSEKECKRQNKHPPKIK